MIYKFCDSDFWNASTAWYSSRPQLSTCFKDTVLVWVPSLLISLVVICEVYKIHHSIKKEIPWNLFNRLRILLTIIIFVLKFCEGFFYLYSIVLGWSNGGARSNFVIVTATLAPVIKAICYAILAIIYYYQRRTGLHTSAAIWYYLLTTVLCDTLDLYSVINSFQLAAYNSVELATKCVHYPLLLLLFLLECRGDKPQIETDLTDSRPQSPELKAGYFSSITFWWFNSFLLFGYKSQITFQTLWRTLERDRAANLVPRMKAVWAKASRFDPRKSYKSANGGMQSFNSIIKVLFKLYWPQLIFAASLKLGQDTLQYVTPMLLKLVLSYMKEISAPQWHGILFALSLLVLPTIQSMLLGNYFYKMQVMGLQVKTMVVGAIYRKALLLSGNSRLQSTSGEIVNLMAVDSQRIQDLLNYINLLWSAPYQIVVAIFLLHRELGWSVFAGVATMVLILPINAYVIRRIKFSQIQVMKIKDSRVKQMNELLSGIKGVKLYAWENSFIDNLTNFRNKEMSYLRTIQTLDAIQVFLWQCSPFMVALVSFAVYINADPANVLTAEKAFVSISLFNLMKFPMAILPTLITTLVLTLVSARRINKFLNSDELVDYVTREVELEAIAIEDGTVSWSQTGDDSAPVLTGIDLHIKPKSFVAIVGQVGSGKSSLLASILGEMHHIKGRFNICKSMSLAYVPQQAWIQNMTVRDNILFGATYNEKLYKQTLSVCSLQPDLETLSGGDLAEIGEKGINLSGGQKQRVSLARACYSDSDIYLLDDPLSALDSHVAKDVFDKVLSSATGVLRHKTRVLATNSLFVLPYVDYIVVIDKGRIVEAGTYASLMASPKGYMTEYMRQYVGQKRQEDSLEESKSAATIVSSEERIMKSVIDKADTGKLIEIEKLETESVSSSVYINYFKAVSSLCLITMTLALVASVIFSVATNVWLGIWSSDSELKENPQNSDLKSLRLGVYAALGGLQSACILIGALALSRGAIRAARKLHAELLYRVLHSPMAFFDTTPIGRIVNRFAKDLDVVDSTLPGTFRSWLNCFLQVISTIFVVCYSFPLFLVIIIPLGIVYYLIQKVFIVTTRQLKRLESITRSPIYSHFGETLSGLSSIRAYGSSMRFIEHSDQLVDRNQSCSYPNIIANRWLSIRLEFFGNLITSAAAMFSVYYKGSISAGVAGLTISYSLNITQTLSWLIRMTSDLETNIVSVERIVEYIGNKLEDLWVKDKRPPRNWPHEGSIRIQRYSTRYRDDLELVLKDMSIDIAPSEKVGIVGRTGSGKSSLSLSLFRILEPASGEIIIDGLNIADYGLHDLRSKLTVIPQDPVLFSGTLRFNLDPLNLYSDHDIWRAIELAHLKPHVANLRLGLDHLVSEYGENFSVGQRQLICLARAILRKSRILILDEATASVDLETDSIVQKTIREIFADCTIITIAHRLHTILDSDRILVLDKGSVKELDSPSNLLQNPESAFSSLVRDAGLDTENLLRNAQNSAALRRPH